MKRLIVTLVIILGFIALIGCAAKQELVVETTAVKTDVLEPVIFRFDKLASSINKINPRFMEGSEIEELKADIKSQVEGTKRFKYVMVLDKTDSTSEKEGYYIHPEVYYIKMQTQNTIDPKRKRYIATGSACFKIYLAENPTKEFEIITSKHKFEKMGQVVRELDQNKMKRELLRVIFLDLASQLGDKFNPSYVMGTIEKISGKTVYVHIKTDQLRDLKTSQQQIAVIDDDNKPLATIEPVRMEDGSITGTLYSKTNASIKIGMKVRARINVPKN